MKEKKENYSKEIIHIKNVKTVEQMFEWKNQKTRVEVEKLYKEIISNDLEWENTDVLYSFLGIYALGVYAYNDKSKFNVTQHEIRIGDGKQKLYSKEFLSSIQSSKEYDVSKLNEVIEPFLNKYSKIGNVFPIWPGGNKAKGLANIGCFDVPELFFAKYYEWFKTLLKVYRSNICFEGYIDKGKPKLKKYSSLEHFLKSVDSPEKYEKFIESICKIIDNRTNDLMKYVALKNSIESTF